MSKISTYEVAPVPKLADKLIGTSVGGEIEDVTYNFTLQELLEVFLPVIPANNLQGILDYGNTATQDINLFGTITTTYIDVTDTANFLDSYFVGETHIEGGLFDATGSIGLAGQVLTSTGEFVEWITLPPIFTPTLQQVLEEGNTSDVGIILNAGLEALDVNTDTATINTNITIDGTITDGDAGVGASGNVLSSTVTGVKWIPLPVYSATSPLLFNSATGVFSIQQATNFQDGYLSSTDWITFNGKQNAGNYITALTGEVTASGPGSATATVSNAAVIGKVLTGFNPTAGTINASDSILTAFGKTQSQINALVGGVQYQGVWNASTNTPTLTSSIGVQGYYYVVNVAGNTNLNGITDWKVGDWAIFSESVWQKVDNTESVSSVNGFTGAVSLTTDNIPEGSTNLYFLNSRARLALSATSPLGYDNSTGVFSIQQANISQNGYLSSTDWNTFNNKQNYLGGTGLVKSSAGTISYITDNSTNWNTAYDNSIISAAVTGTGTKTLTLTQQDAGTITASWTDLGLTSVGVSMPSAFNVANSPLTSNGTIAITGAGTASQYVRGDGTLAVLPTGGGGGGASVSYYLNGSINQGTIGGVTYYEMNKVPVIGVGTDFSRSTNGYIASFLTDVNDPALLQIPAGNWNFETYFNASSGGGSPTFYIELYKYDGVVFTLISSNSASPKLINDGTSIEAYFSALAVPQTALTLTDRLAVRIYVTTAGRTITLHTENSHLCQVITTFTTGITAINGLTAQVQNLTTGTSGTDFNINSLVATHTFNLPVASATNTGKLSSTDWSTFNGKVPYTGATGAVDLGAFGLTAVGITANSLYARGSGVQGGYLYLKQGIAPYSTLAGSNSISADGTKYIFLSDAGSSNAKTAIFDLTSLANNTARTYTLPDASGTLALTSQLVAYLPLAGGFMSGNIFLNNNIAISGQLFGTTSYSAMLAMSPSDKVLIDNGGRGVIFGSTIGQGIYTYTFPTASGTLALTSNLSSYVPYTGATANLDMGTGLFGINAGQFLLLAKNGSDSLGISAYQGFLNLSGNDGIYLQLNASNNLSFFGKTSGTTTGPLMTFGRSGNLTVGGTSLLNKLSVQSDVTFIANTPSSYALGVANGGGNDMTLGTAATYGAIQTWSEKPLVLQGQGNNVLIGTTINGGFKLDVNGTFRVNGVATFGSTLSNGTFTYTLPSASGTLALTSNIPSNIISGSGTAGAIPVFTATGVIGNSTITEAEGSVYVNNYLIANAAEFQGNSSFRTTGNSIGNSIQISLGTTVGSTMYANIISTIVDNVGSQFKGRLDFQVRSGNNSFVTPLVLAHTGAATFSSSVTTNANEGFIIAPSSGPSYINYKIGSTSYSFIGVAGNANDFITGSALGDLNIRAANSQKILFSTNNGGNSAMTISSGGNVGISMNNPRARLDVSDGTNNTSGEAIFQGLFTGPTRPSTSDLTAILTVQSNSAMGANNGGSIAFGGRALSSNSSGANWAGIGGLKENGTSSDYSGYLQFWTRGGGTTEKMRITSSGTLGIGLTNPTSTTKLMVAGGIGFGNNTDGAGNLSYGGRISAKVTTVTGGAGAILIHRGLGSVAYFILVSGLQGQNRFVDLIYGTNTVSPSVLASSTGGTSAPTRTYTQSGENIFVSLSGGDTWTITTTGLGAMES